MGRSGYGGGDLGIRTYGRGGVGMSGEVWVWGRRHIGMGKEAWV